MPEKTPLQKARKRYSDKRKMVGVSFNLDTEQDLYQAAIAMPKFSVWVKEQLKSHIKQCSK